MKILSLSAAVCLLSLICSCNAEDNSKKETATATVEAQSPPSAPSGVSDDVSQKDVVQVALGSKDHTTLVDALKQADLVDVLKKSGPFTVFAPTNAAFDKLPKGTVEDLMKPENKEKLADILQYHVSVGIYKEDMLQDGQVLGQVNSQSVKITKADGKIKINGSANVLTVIPASNGLIYVVDEVLLPPKK
ncbi:MAG: fasciclin domain-containing protein [Bacteroidetes bacterium]|nr:fasciclin domain-containing protein [Bacteroidota bacterium]